MNSINASFGALQNSYNRESTKVNEKSTMSSTGINQGMSQIASHGFPGMNQSQFSSILTLLSNLISQLSQYQDNDSDTGSSSTDNSGADSGNIGENDGAIGIDDPIGMDPIDPGEDSDPICNACTPKTVSLMFDESNVSPNPSYDPNDITRLQLWPLSDPDAVKGFGEHNNDHTFLHTIDTSNLGLDLNKQPESGTLTLIIRGSGSNDSIGIVDDNTGPGQANPGDFAQHVSTNTSNPFEGSVVTDNGDGTKTVTIELNQASLESIQDGKFSYFVQDDHDVLSTKLDINGFKPAEKQVGTDSDDTLDGKSQITDIIFGRGGDDKIDGKSGDDCLYGNNGDDIIFGGSGDDYAYGGNGDDEVNGGSGNDYIWGGRGDNVLNGGSGNDTISLDSNSQNKVDGGSGDDEIKSNLGVASPSNNIRIQNEIDGGSGQNDVIKYSGDRYAYDISPIPGTSPTNEYTITHIASNTVDLIKNIESLVFDTGPNESL